MPLINKVPSSSATEEISTVTANAADVIADKKFIDAEGDEIIGTMQDNGQVNDEITDNGTYDIPNGYHNGSGKYTVDVPLQLDTFDATAKASEIVDGKTAYGSGKKITGDMSETSMVLNDMTVNQSGLVTSVAYVPLNGHIVASTQTKTHQLPTKGAATITPGTSAKTIGSGVYLTGDQTIKGDPNLDGANIKKGESIFGVPGTYTPGITISQANRQSNHTLLCPKMPVVNKGLLAIICEDTLTKYSTSDNTNEESWIIHDLLLYCESTLTNVVNYYAHVNFVTKESDINLVVLPQIKFTGSASSYPVTMVETVYNLSLTISVNSSGLLVIGDPNNKFGFMSKYKVFMN